MRVLMVHNYYDSRSPSGEGRSFEEEAELLRKFGHDVLTYEVHNDEIGQYNPLEKIRLGWETVWSSRSSRRLEELVRSNDRQVVHFQNTLPLVSPAAYWGARAGGAAVVQSLRNFRLVCPSANLFYNGRQCERCVGKFPWPGLKRGCYRGSRVQTAAVVAMNSFHDVVGTWQNKVDRYIVAAQYTRGRLLASGIPENLVRVKENYVPDPGPRASGQEYALYIGRLSEEKGLSTLMRAWSGLDVPLRIAGSGPLEEQVRSWASGQSCVRFEGRLGPDQVGALLERAAFVVMPSTWNETFGRAILEGYASGLPAVTTRTGAQQELVQEGETGWLFEPGDWEALRRIAIQAWGDPAGTLLKGGNARRRYEAHYGAKENCAKLIAIYKEAIQRRHGQPETQPRIPGQVRT